MSSKAFGSKLPVHPHLVQGKTGGLANEVEDLRSDVEQAFVVAETPGHGGTNLIAVEEFVNPIAADDNAIKTNVASVAAATSYSTTALNGVLGAGVISPPRNITITTDAGGTPADAPATAIVTGLDVNGDAIHEHFVVSQVPGEATGNYAFAYVTNIAMPAGDGVGATLSFGVGEKIGLASKVKLRNTVPNILAEMMDGSFISGGGLAAGATTPTNITVVATNQAATAVNTATTYAGSLYLVDPDAASLTGIVNTVNCANGVQALAAQFDYARKLQLRMVGGGAAITAGTCTIVGVGADGAALSQAIDITGGTKTVITDNAFATVTSATVAGQVGGGAGTTIGIGLGEAFGLPIPAGAAAVTVRKTVVDTENETVAGVDATARAVAPTTAANAVHDYLFYFSYTLTTVQSAHNHTQDTHNHLQNAHSHVGAAGTFATPAVGAPNGTYQPATACNAAHDFQVVYERDLT